MQQRNHEEESWRRCDEECRAEEPRLEHQRWAKTRRAMERMVTEEQREEKTKVADEANDGKDPQAGDSDAKPGLRVLTHSLEKATVYLGSNHNLRLCWKLMQVNLLDLI